MFEIKTLLDGNRHRVLVKSVLDCQLQLHEPSFTQERLIIHHVDFKPRGHREYPDAKDIAILMISAEEYLKKKKKEECCAFRP